MGGQGVVNDDSRLLTAPPDFHYWAKPAAIMVMVAHDVFGPAVLLIRRPQSMGEHPGQIACPGGRHDPGRDRDLWETAVRETAEEVGVAVPDSAFRGYLAPVHISVTGYTLLPCVAVFNTPPLVQASSAEVAESQWVPLALLARHRRMVSRAWQGNRVMVPEFPLPWALVWGATARVLDNFLAVADKVLAS